MKLDTLVEQIVNEVMKKINEENNRNKKFFDKLLVLVEDSEGKKEEINNIIKKLQEKFEVSVIFLAGEKNIEENNSTKNFNLITPKIQNYREFIRNFDKIFVLFLSKNTCAKVAYGIRDTIITNIIAEGILNNNDIYATIDNCINNEKINMAYSIMLRGNVNSLKNFGIKFFKLKDIETHFLKEKINKKKIITLDDMKKFNDKKLNIDAGTLITDLAREFAKENNIKIYGTQERGCE